MKLEAETVSRIFNACLSTDEDAIHVEGVVHGARFDKDRLEAHRKNVQELLEELPDEFRVGGGGGWSFLNACGDRHGNQWTGLHLVMEQLFMLGIGLNLAQFLLPRHMWEVFPRGMPYIAVNVYGGNSKAAPSAETNPDGHGQTPAAVDLGLYP